jgi:GT2 family glycosyltransferase
VETDAPMPTDTTALDPLDVSVVTYNSARWLEAFVESLLGQTVGPGRLSLFVRDNGSRDGTLALLDRLRERFGPRLARFDVEADGRNLGFGLGHNRNAARGRAPFLLVLNPDLELEPDALARLAAAVARADDDVAAFELRQVPYEHPKRYDPVTGETGWSSAAALLLRRAAFDAVGGFDERIFLYGEDVDLSWRLRDAGWRLLYVPGAVVRHYTYAEPGEVKPAQFLGSTLANLNLRVRFGTWRDVALGLGRYLVLFAAPERFAGQRRGLLRNLGRFARDAWHFRRGRRPRPAASFDGWDYGPMREGAFYPVSPPSARPATPLVSVLVRTTGRPAVLREALCSVARQTYPAIETVVVEDGPPAAQSLIATEFGELQVVYRATGRRTGRCAAGNLALSLASGEYLVFLDDDDLLYADHVEVLVDAVQRQGALAAYALAREVPTQVDALEPYRYTERLDEAQVLHLQPFSRAVLWHHNYMPIQSVLFHRSLYERLGGFDPDLENLEDWNLWTRYALEHDFAYVAKETSVYRVPGTTEAQRRRAEAMRRYLPIAEAKQAEMRVALSPRDVVRMREELNRALNLVAVFPLELGQLVRRLPGGRLLYPVLRRLYRWARRLARPASPADRLT